jgi:hypothetical protein
MLRTLFLLTILAGALTDGALAHTPDAGCALPSEPKGIPAAIDAAITGPADKDLHGASRCRPSRPVRRYPRNICRERDMSAAGTT